MEQLDYVPILKFKSAEIGALGLLDDEDKSKILPLLEVVPVFEVPKKYKDTYSDNVQKYLTEVKAKEDAEKILSSYGDYCCFAIDCGLIPSRVMREGYLKAFLDFSKELFLKPFVSVNLNDMNLLSCLGKWAKNGGLKRVIVRLTEYDLIRKNEVLESIREIRKDIDVLAIVVDLRENCKNDIYEKSISFIRGLNDEVGGVGFWAISSGAFPKDMSMFRIDDPYEKQRIERVDFLNWKKNNAESKDGPRIIFSDYTIRHPIYDPMIERHQSSCTIKYTKEEYWQILRGSANKRIHYVYNAYLLASHSDFSGKNHCAGDVYIQEKANLFAAQGEEVKKTGNPTSWLRAGITHHIKTTIGQIDRIYGL